MTTKIEWCEETWNPITGCSKISAGCANCYAERMSKRLAGRYGYPKEDPFKVTFHPDRLEQPFHWKKPRRIFVCSMGDLFHDDVKDCDINSVFLKMLNCDRHTYIILTKRPERMKDFVSIGTGWRGRMENVWLGVTAENQKTADERIPILLDIPAAVRFISVEPMLSEIDLKLHSYAQSGSMHSTRRVFLNWIIAGTESGPKKRPAKTKWIRSLKDQCVSAGIPFFLKQREIAGKVVKMPEFDGKIWNQLPR